MDSAPDSRYPARRTTQSRAFNRAPVAQLDRVLPSEGRGHTFESCRARHKIKDLGHFRVAFFAPYGIHTEIRLSATPVRSPPRRPISWPATPPGKVTRGPNLAPRGGVAATAPPLPCCQTSQGFSVRRPVTPAARRARRSLTSPRAAYSSGCPPSCRPWWLPW